MCEAEVVAGCSFASSAGVGGSDLEGLAAEGYRDCWRIWEVVLETFPLFCTACAFEVSWARSLEVFRVALVLLCRGKALKNCRIGWRGAGGAAQRALDAMVSQALLIVLKRPSARTV